MASSRKRYVTRKSAGRKISDPRAELRALRGIGRALSSAWDVAATLDTISRTTARVMRMDSCSIYLLDKSGRELILKASTGLSPHALNQAKLRVGEGITGYAARSGKPVAVRDVVKDARLKYQPETEEQKFHSLLAVPLISQGTLIGAMNVRTVAVHRYTRSEIELLSLIGDLAAGALERAVLHDDLQRQIDELSTLAQLSKTFTAPLYLDEMLLVVVEMAAKVMNARACALLLFDREHDQLLWRASHGLSRAHALSSPLQVRDSLTGQAIVRGEPVSSRDLVAEPLYRNRKLAKEEGLHAFLAVPLRARNTVIGAFNCYLDAVHEFSPKEIELFSMLANQTALALDNANLAMNSLLVREMHHRVKNNLQMVAMMLRLQLRGQVTPREVLTQTINRILSIAAVHEALSQSGLRLIELKGLIQQAALVATQNMLHPGQDVRVSVEGTTTSVEPPEALPAFDGEIPGDISSAAYLVAAGVLAESGEVVVRNVGINPTRAGFLRALERMGATIDVNDRWVSLGEPGATLVARPGPLSFLVVEPHEVPSMVDEIPLLACLASRAEGLSVFRGVGELRVKESDRLALVAANLAALGVAARTEGDTLFVEGAQAPPRGRVVTAGDHRLAMAFATLGVIPGAAVELDDTRSVAISYPNFFRDLASVLHAS